LERAETLADAYSHSVGTVRFQLVTRALLLHIPDKQQRVVDVGGGFGQQAIMLARVGHSVTVVDIDPAMLSIAVAQLSEESLEVSSRVRLVLGDGETAENLVGTGFDLACCHSVLMYQHDPAPMVSALVRLVRPGGLISLLCVNAAASAMRSGLQGRWHEAAAKLQPDSELQQRHLTTYEHTVQQITDMLSAAGARAREWYGVGVFTDHRTEKIVVDDPEEIYAVEWLAGGRDPYRQVARCFHLLAERICPQSAASTNFPAEKRASADS